VRNFQSLKRLKITHHRNRKLQSPEGMESAGAGMHAAA